MKISGFWTKAKPGTAINKVFKCRDWERLFNVLEALEGEGCRIEKPLDQEGRGWRIVVDGVQSDAPHEASAGGLLPFDFVETISGWRVNLNGADVQLDNARVEQDPEMKVTEEGYTDAIFSRYEVAEVHVWRKPKNGEGGPTSYIWNVGTPLTPDLDKYCVRKIPLGSPRVKNSTYAQTFHGSICLYSHNTSECIDLTPDSGKYEVRELQEDSSSLGDFTRIPGYPLDQMSVVIRDGQEISYAFIQEIFSSFKESVDTALVHEFAEANHGDWKYWYDFIDKWFRETAGYPFHPAPWAIGEDFAAGDILVGMGGGWERFDETVVAKLGVAPAASIVEIRTRIDELSDRIRGIRLYMNAHEQGLSTSVDKTRAAKLEAEAAEAAVAGAYEELNRNIETIDGLRGRLAVVMDRIAEFDRRLTALGG